MPDCTVVNPFKVQTMRIITTLDVNIYACNLYKNPKPSHWIRAASCWVILLRARGDLGRREVNYEDIIATRKMTRRIPNTFYAQLIYEYVYIYPAFGSSLYVKRSPDENDKPQKANNLPQKTNITGQKHPVKYCIFYYRQKIYCVHTNKQTNVDRNRTKGKLLKESCLPSSRLLLYRYS